MHIHLRRCRLLSLPLPGLSWMPPLSSRLSFVSLLFIILLFVLILHSFHRILQYHDDLETNDNLSEFEVKRKSVRRRFNITIAVIVDEENKLDTLYDKSMNTVRCYAAMHDYTLKVVSTRQFLSVCRQSDFFFRRHCVVAELLTPEVEWLLFIDADVGIVNPRILIEEYIDAKFDITFYDRMINWEIAMGSYLVRNSAWSRQFLKDFADYEVTLPNSFHGTDNGAIHAFIQERFLPELVEEAAICKRIWAKSQDYPDLFLYEACIRAVIGEQRQFDRLRILKKGTGWLRDIWLTKSLWSEERDFMLHGWKEKDRRDIDEGVIVRIFNDIVMDRFNWYYPLKEKLNLKQCMMKTVHWKWEESLLRSKEEIDGLLRSIVRKVDFERWTTMKKVAAYVR